jgi:hypothetical protein
VTAVSLTSFVIRPDVRQRLRVFPKPRIATHLELLAPPLSNRYSLVGTAFDYLLRFYVRRLNPKAKEERWVAEAGLSKLGTQATSHMHYDIDAEELSFSGDNGTWETGQGILKRAKAAYERYLVSGSITDALLESVIGLARLDVVYRSGFVDENLGKAYREDIRDLRKLISLVDSAEFRAKNVCLLNPHFGVGSRLIGGADADLLIDGALIDVKTTKNIELSREHFDQLLGYLVMHEIWGANGLKRKPRISKLGIYFARYASLQVFDAKDIVRDEQYLGFVRWFKEAVEQRAAKRHNKRMQRTRQSVTHFAKRKMRATLPCR